jgi:lipid A 3-O-deacylase
MGLDSLPAPSVPAGVIVLGLLVGTLPLAWSGPARADDIFSEVRLGVLDHDASFIGGREHGADFNGEILFTSPLPQDFGASWPLGTQWIARPRPSLGIDANSAGATSQIYAGLTWTSLMAWDILSEQDRLEFDYFFGPAFNNGYLDTRLPDRKSLGSNLLFHLGIEVTYWLTPRIGLGVYFEHSSNAGLETPNDSLNNLGMRVGYRF